MAISVKSRAQLALSATTSLPPSEVVKLVRAATREVRGGGTSLLTTGLQNLGAQVHIERESDSVLALSITSGKRLVELCTFAARVTTDHGGRTSLRVGGLESYRTTQSTVFFVPVGPKMIAGYDPYQRFLDHVAETLSARDPNAVVTVRTPD